MNVAMRAIVVLGTVTVILAVYVFALENQKQESALDTVGSCVYSIKETMTKNSPKLKIAYVGHTALDTPQTLDSLHSIDMMIQFKGMNQSLELFCAGKAGDYSWSHDKAQAIGRLL